MGARVRDLLEQIGPEVFGVKVRPDKRAADNWRIDGREGGMQTCGMGGALTGKGADLLLIDDPVKNSEEALSPTVRQKHWDWYASTADTRLEPNAVVALTMTLWHQDDLGGRILEREAAEWDVLRLPGLAEADDPLGRAEGEPLWPERYGREWFEKKRKRDPFWFSALYQCRPRPREGSTFHREWFDGKTVQAPPDATARVRFWDRAATLGGGDWTAGVRMSKGDDGLYYVEHIDRFQLAGHDRNARMRRRAVEDGLECRVRGEQEPGSSGKEEVGALVLFFAGFDVAFAVSTGSKEVRAAPFASQCQAGNVRLVAGEWNRAYLDELCDFPNGSKHDDQVDGSSGAFNELAAIEGAEGEWGDNPFAYLR